MFGRGSSLVAVADIWKSLHHVGPLRTVGKVGAGRRHAVHWPASCAFCVNSAPSWGASSAPIQSYVYHEDRCVHKKAQDAPTPCPNTTHITR